MSGNSPGGFNNPILKMLGTKYEMRLRYLRYEISYEVVIRNQENRYVSRVFTALEAEAAYYDALLFTIEWCIRELETGGGI